MVKEWIRGGSYRVSNKKLFHKSEEKMHKKLMT